MNRERKIKKNKKIKIKKGGKGGKGGPKGVRKEEVKERSRRTERGRRDPREIDFNLPHELFRWQRGAPLCTLSGSSGDFSSPRDDE